MDQENGTNYRLHFKSYDMFSYNVMKKCYSEAALRSVLRSSRFEIPTTTEKKAEKCGKLKAKARPGLLTVTGKEKTKDETRKIKKKLQLRVNNPFTY